MRRINLNKGVSWGRPEEHAHRALQVFREVKIHVLHPELFDISSKSKHLDFLSKKFDELEKEIENLYHSFYMK